MLALVLKPLGLLVLFSFTWICAKLLHKFIPEGRIKRFLFIRWKV